MVKFYSGKIAEQKPGTTLEIPLLIRAESGLVEPGVPMLCGSLPLKFFLCGSIDFRHRLADFQDSATRFLQEHHVLDKRGNGFSPHVIVDLSKLPSTLDERLVGPLSLAIFSVLDSFVTVMRDISDMRKATQTSRLENALTCNFSRETGFVEKFVLARRLCALLRTHPMRVVVTEPQGEIVEPAELISVRSTELLLLLPIKSTSETISSVLPPNYAETMYTRLLQIMCEIELESIGHPSISETVAELTQPLELTYGESFALLARKVKVAVEDKDKAKTGSVELFRTLLSLPILAANLADAIRIFEGVTGTAVKAETVLITVKPGSATAAKCWMLAVGPSELDVSLLAYSASEHVIPSENEIVEELMQKTQKSLPLEMEAAIINMRCVRVDGKCYQFDSPLVTSPGPYSALYRLFHAEPYKPFSAEKDGLLPYLSGCVVSLHAPTAPAAPAKITSADDGKFRLDVPIANLDGPCKLVISLGPRLVLAKVLLCYEDAKIPHVFLQGTKRGALFVLSEAGTSRILKYMHFKAPPGAGWTNTPAMKFTVAEVQKCDNTIYI